MNTPTPVWHGLWLAGSGFPFPPTPVDLDVVVCTARECWFNPTAKRRMDLPLTNGELLHERHRAALENAAREVVDAVAKQELVIVRCHWGVERSALVVALALMEITGASPEQTVNFLRERRDPSVLDQARGDFLGWLGVGL